MLTIQSVAAGAHAGQCCSDDREHGEEVQLEHPAHVSVGHAFDRSEPAPSGVVDQHVDAAEVLLGRAYGLLHLCLVGDVQRQDEHPVAVGLGPRVQLLGSPRGEHHAVPGVQCGLGEGHAEPARCATGDEPVPH
jgi:hypothetical protein